MDEKKPETPFFFARGKVIFILSFFEKKKKKSKKSNCVLDINSTQCTDSPLSSYVIISLLAYGIG